MGASGHGVSASVRNHVSTWVSDETLSTKLYDEYCAVQGNKPKDTKEAFSRKLKSSAQWKRKSRSRSKSGWERTYVHDSIPENTVKLVVHSPESDFSADSYLFFVKNKPVAGGKTKLKSVFYSTAVKDKVETDKVETEVYTKFTPKELEAIEGKLKYGDGFASLFSEREV